MVAHEVQMVAAPSVNARSLPCVYAATSRSSKHTPDSGPYAALRSKSAGTSKLACGGTRGADESNTRQ